MHILIEGFPYDSEALNAIFADNSLITTKGSRSTVNCVGYYHSFENNNLVYIIPKVFLINGLVFDKFTPEGLLKDDTVNSFKHGDEFLWVRQLMVYFYKSLAEFRKRCSESDLIDSNLAMNLNTNIGDKEYSYLDLLLSFINFHKKNDSIVLYRHLENKANRERKPKWEKTIRKYLPILDSNNSPIYFKTHSTVKCVNIEEELLAYFYSIINHFNIEHSLRLQLDKSYEIISGAKFESLQKNGLRRLSKIKHRYYNDTLKRMYRLCEMYFSRTDRASSKKNRYEFITVSNYNIIFEDMVDKLFSDKLSETVMVNDMSLNDLRYSKDGKIIDHIYEDVSLLDTSKIFFIGDSKYYKPGNVAGSHSVYKQFTYAKNVIQFNIDLFNNTDAYYTPMVRYRDEVTEGYSISPNFFIYGYIENHADFVNPQLQSLNEPKLSSHYKMRLFDRDTLFVHQYQINFLFVLRCYSQGDSRQIRSFREQSKLLFRKQFIDFFNNPEECNYVLYEKAMDIDQLQRFVTQNFKRLIGKFFYTNDGKLIIAVHSNDFSLVDLVVGFYKKVLQ